MSPRYRKPELRISPSGLDSAAACLRKHHFKSHMRLPVERSQYQEMGVKSHQAIEVYSLTGEEPEDKFYASILQMVKSLLREPPYYWTEVEVWSQRPADKKLDVKQNRVVELPDWCGRTDFQVHMYIDYIPETDGMDTWDWKQRANMSFRSTPVEDKRDDPQAIMYQLANSFRLTGHWEEAGTHWWHILDRKAMKHDKTCYAYARGEAYERWMTVYDPFVDLLLEIFHDKFKDIDPSDVPATGILMTDAEGGRECDKWSGCDFARRCMACGTPVYGVLSNFLQRDHKAKQTTTWLQKLRLKT